MKRSEILLLGAVAAILAGCATQGMKSTPFYEGKDVRYVGDAADRGNLWPVAYWRNPVGSAAWPLVSFADDHFAIRPVYSQYRQNGADGEWDEFSLLWPLAQVDTKHRRHRVFLAFWGKDYSEHDYQALFPVYWNGKGYNCLFPVWYYGSTTNSWSFNTVGGLIGAKKTKEGYRSSWAFPLWYEDNAGLFATLLYGQTPDSYWFFPLWYQSDNAFASLFYAQGTESKSSWWSVPMLLSWGGERRYEVCTNTTSTGLLGLGWHKKDRITNKGGTSSVSTLWGLANLSFDSGEMDSAYAFPLFSWEKEGTFLTPLGGRKVEDCNGTTNVLITPLIGITSGAKSGGWVCPLWSHEVDADFDKRLSYLNSPTLPEDIHVSEHTNMFKSSGQYGKPYLQGEFFTATDSTTILLHDVRHTIRGSGDGCCTGTNVYHICSTKKRGNELLFKWRSEHKIGFDMNSREKISEYEKDESSFLIWLYEYDRKFDCMTAGETRRHRVLWKLWDWQWNNGDVSLDIFPGFTYDNRESGYFKTSLLWRLFRCESAPGSGLEIDFLFLPIWRGDI